MYDNTVSARTYLSYIAEQAEGFAVIGRDGKLYIKTFELQKGEKIAEGKNINFTSPIVEKIIIEKLEGSSTQTARSGKNLFNGTLKAGLFLASNGVTFVQNDNYVCSEKFISVTGEETYSISNKNGIEGIYYVLQYDNDKNFIKASNNSTTATSFTTTISSNCCYVRVEIGNSSAAPTVAAIEDFQIEKGPATEYEQYGTSPSPDYPSPIENITGDIEIKDVGKNLVKQMNWKQLPSIATGATVTSVNGYGTDYIAVDNTKNYVFSYSGTADSKYVAFYDESKNFLGYDTNLQIDNYKNWNVTKYVRLRIDCSENAVTNLQLEIGTVATPYVPYKEQTVYFSLGEEQKLMEGSYLADDGIHHTRKQVVLDGSDDENWKLWGASLSNVERFYINLNTPTINITNSLCSHFKFINGNQDEQHFRWSLSQGIYKQFVIYIDKSKATTVAELKTWLQSNPITLEYELSEEETVPYTAEQQEAWEKIKNLKLFEGVNNIASEGKIILYSVEKIELRLFKNYKWGEKFKITRVRYYDGTQLFEKGDTTGNTVYISQDNMYIVDQDQINNIYNAIQDLEFYSFEGESIIDPALDTGDIVVIDGKNVIYQGSMQFSGRWIANIESKIQCKAKEETTTRTPSQKIINRRVQSSINQIDGKITQLAQETKENTEKISKHEQTLESISDKVSNIEDLTNNVEGVKTIVLANCVEGKLLNLHIYGNNTVFKYLYPSDTLYPSDDLYPYGDSRIVVTDKDNNQTIYELGVLDVLRQNDEVCDEFILENGEAKVIRRVNKSGTTKAKESVEDLGKLEILLKEGTNTITIQNYTARIKAKWAIKSNYTDIFATKVEMSSSIEQTAEKIESKVSKTYETLEEARTQYSNFKQTTNEISIQVVKKVGKNEIISSINQSAEQVQVEADKININGIVSANGNFKVDTEGNMECNNGKFKGNIFLDNGKKVIGGDGLLTNLHFETSDMYSGFSIIGFFPDWDYSSFKKKDAMLCVTIPENFIVTQAYISLDYSAIDGYDNNNSSVMGRPNQIKLYYSKSKAIGALAFGYGGGYFNDCANLYGTQIVSGSFIAAGVTDTTVTTTELKTLKTADIKNIISSGNYVFYVETAATTSSTMGSASSTTTDALSKTFRGKLILDIIGYMK